jgi:hypothetical protein
MRVLLVGNANARSHGARFYSIERRLANGFVRNGHQVWFFGDRDHARAASLFGSSRWGTSKANAAFLDLVRGFGPEWIVVMHSSLISDASLAAARGLVPGVRIAQVCVDPLFRPVNMAFLQSRARVVDASFVTTAGPVLAACASARAPAAYLPNPVDASMDRARGFERRDQGVDIFWAARAGQGDYPEDPRVRFPLHLAAAGDLVVDYHGIGGRPQLFGLDCYARLADARMAFNLNSDRVTGAPAPAPAEALYLYNSDRLAQIIGSGVLAVSMRINQLNELFPEGEAMVFADSPAEALEVVRRYKRDESARQRIAQKGWRLGHDDYQVTHVTRYMEEVTFEQPFSRTYAWPTRLWEAPG